MGSLLVIDEESDSRLLTKRILAREGHPVEAFESMEEALEWIRRYPPDLVIASAGKYGERATKLVKFLKSAGVTGPRIIFRTGVGSLAAVREAVSGNVLEVIEKTADPEELASIVRSALSQETRTG